jgi:phage/plasmid-like protein (TIGR03299 family)
MAHLVETMAYTNEVPWHGLGFSRPEGFKNVKQLIKDAKLDWTVDRTPMYLADNTPRLGDPIQQEVPGFAALVRSSDRKVLDVVGSQYKPVQNHEAFEFFTEFVEAGGAKMETAGSLRGGKYVWGLANLNASFKLRGDDRVNGYLLVGCPHEQGKSLLIKFTSVRVVCNNTLTLALGREGNEWRMSHRMAFDSTTMGKAKEALGIAKDQLGEFERNARILQKINISKSDAIKILAGVFAPDAELAPMITDFDANGTPRLKSLIGAYNDAPGAQPGNGWGLLNAVTYYADHMASRTSDKRLSNAWLGRTAQQKTKMLDTLLQMA